MIPEDETGDRANRSVRGHCSGIVRGGVETRLLIQAVTARINTALPRSWLQATLRITPVLISIVLLTRLRLSRILCLEKGIAPGICNMGSE